MIPITKQEADKVRGVYPKLMIPRTMRKKSKRHRYYLVEDVKYLKLIADSNEEAANLVREKQRNHNKNIY